MFKNIPKKKIENSSKINTEISFCTLHWRIKDKFFSLLKK